MTSSATLAGIAEDDYLNRPTALYSFYDVADALLYVGVCFDPSVRWAYHAREKAWWSEVARKEIEWFDSRHAALEAETHAIETRAPRYNITGAPPPAPPTPRPVPEGTGSAYHRLADELRREILSGDLPSGARLPSERELQQTFNLARDTVRLAVAVLRGEGLIVVRHGQATRVREVYDKEVVTLEPGQRVSTRMPTPRERRERGIPEGVPVFVIVDEQGVGDLLPGNRVDIVGPLPNS